MSGKSRIPLLYKTGPIACPYCGLEQSFVFEAPGVARIAYCDVDEGGCDRMLIVTGEIHISATLRTVDGEALGMPPRTVKNV